MLLLILVLGSIWNYISADMIGMSKFLNINTRFLWSCNVSIFIEYKKNRFSILIFLAVNLLSAMYLYNESYVYHLLDDLGRIRAILLVGWIYILIYTFEKISEGFKNIFLLLTSILPFIALGKSESRAGALSLFLVVFIPYF